jgi:hypothetical protein
VNRAQLCQALIAFAAVLGLLYLVPAPAGCGCAKRKAKLQQLGGELFGA